MGNRGKNQHLIDFTPAPTQSVEIQPVEDGRLVKDDLGTMNLMP
jgi:hypothetical protein